MGKRPPDIIKRLTVAKDFLRIVGPVVDASSVLQWKTSDGFLTIVLRSILRRQYDALEAIVRLIEEKHADLTVPLLRPACEEFLWIAFLRKLTPKDREEVVFWKSQVEVFDSLNAQYNDAGADQMKRLGFPDRFLDQMRTNNANAKRALRTIGTELGWPLKGNQAVPSVRQIAIQAGNEDLYLLIYHATSRTVHFSVSEMLRRAWGHPRRINISSGHMGEYWAQFSLYWAVRIFFFAFVEIIEELEDQGVSLPRLDDHSLDAIMRRFVRIGKIPIITPEELNLHLKDRLRAFQI